RPGSSGFRRRWSGSCEKNCGSIWTSQAIRAKASGDCRTARTLKKGDRRLATLQIRRAQVRRPEPVPVFQQTLRRPSLRRGAQVWKKPRKFPNLRGTSLAPKFENQAPKFGILAPKFGSVDEIGRARLRPSRRCAWKHRGAFRWEWLDPRRIAVRRRNNVRMQ